MQHSDSVQYLERAGFHFKPAESPDLWTHLESRFGGAGIVGPKFAPMSASFVAELIGQGEDVLLEALVEMHRRSGALGRVVQVIDLPYVVGTGAAIPLAKADPARVLRLIDQPGTPKERIVHVVPASADDIPVTTRMTATGGLYPDGHTAGYFDLRPGGPETGDDESAVAWLATRDEIAALLSEMEANLDDVTIRSRKETEDMIAKAGRLLR